MAPARPAGASVAVAAPPQNQGIRGKDIGIIID
jgi:hypothetical protein